MSVSASPVEHYLAQFRERAPTLPGAHLPWLADARRDAAERFASAGFPGPREEAWKYTRTTPIEKVGFRLPEAPQAVSAETAGRWLVPDLDAHLLVFVAGRYAPGLSRPGALPAGATVLPLAQAVSTHAQALEPHLGRILGARGHAFTALNTAFVADGAWLQLAPGTVLDRPVHLVFLSGTGEAETVSHPRVLIVAGADSAATVVETHAAVGNGSCFNNALTEVTLDAGAHIVHHKLHRESAQGFHVGTLQVRQGAGSRFHGHAVALGGRLVRNDVNVRLEAPGAVCDLVGLFVASGREHVDFHTRVDHAEPRGTSRQTYKGILAGRARGVFDGRVVVHQDAQGSDAQQANHNLLLSRDAEMDTKPQLEIYADDVKCAHGATVGQLDEQMVFYLRSRGLSEGAARGLLTYGFAQEIVDRVASEPLRRQLGAQLLEHMPHAENVRGIVE